MACNIEAIKDRIGGLLDNNGVTGTMRAAYYAFASKICKLCTEPGRDKQKIISEVNKLVREYLSEYEGVDETILRKISNVLCPGLLST